MYYGFRYYLPQSGRWASKDPIQEKGGPNLLGMCLNDPVNQFDVLGQMDYPFDADRRDQKKDLQIRAALTFDLAIVFAAGATYDDIVRTFYEQADRKLSETCNSLVSKGIWTQQEAASYYNTQRNVLVEQFRNQSTPVGRWITEKMKPLAKLPTMEQLYAKGKTDAEILAKAAANKQVTSTVAKLAKGARACGAIALTFELYRVATADPAVRPSLIAGSVGGVAGASAAAWAVGELGGEVGFLVGGPPGAAVGAVSGAVIGGIGGLSWEN